MTASSYVERVSVHDVPAWQNYAPALGTLTLELTERCNNDCIHCYINLPAGEASARRRELTTAQILRILDEADALGCVYLKCTGGEPFLRADFEPIYLHARRLGMKVLLFTNGTLITRRWAELFARIPPLCRIEVTVYGMTQASYEAVTRVPGTHAACRRGMELLLEHQVPFVVKGAFLTPTKDELEAFTAWAATIPWMRGRRPKMSMFFDPRCRDAAGAPERTALIKSLRARPQETVELIGQDPEGYAQAMRRYYARHAGPSGGRLFACGSGVRSGTVDAYGYFQPCMLLRRSDCVYDLKQGTLQDALERFFPEMRTATAQNPEYLARCGRCFLKGGVCQQCPAKSWMESGALDTPVEYLCEQAHAQARFLGLLEDGEQSWEIADASERVQAFVAGRRGPKASNGPQTGQGCGVAPELSPQCHG